jgi:hypothetical protein
MYKLEDIKYFITFEFSSYNYKKIPLILDLFHHAKND